MIDVETIRAAPARLVATATSPARVILRDLQTYRILAAHPDASMAATCFHAQQSVEKALKAVLTAHGATFPRTHNLEELGLLVTESGIGLPAPARDLRRLTPFAVNCDYQGT